MIIRDNNNQQSKMIRKKLLLSFVMVVFCSSIWAQSTQIAESNPNYSDEVFVSFGMNVPMNDKVGTDFILGIQYGHSFYNGLGFQAGIQYSPSIAKIDNVFGIPLAFTYKTRSRSSAERFLSGVNNAVESVTQNWYRDDNHLGDGIFGFLAGLYDRVEFYAGITPGYLSGDNSKLSVSSDRVNETRRWAEKAIAFSLSLDAGINLNFKIWRFDLKLMPSFHYNILNNYILHTETKNILTGHSINQSETLRWFFTINGGLGFHF